MAFISDYMTNDFVAVYAFQKLFTEEIKIALPFLSTFYYCSDRSSSQYENFKNFTNLLHHKKDFRLDAEWHFFATSHGKNACDCVGGTLKRLAAKASLQRHLQNQILTGCGTHVLSTNSGDVVFREIYCDSSKVSC